MEKVCNKCGKAFKKVNDIYHEDFLEVKKDWGFFSAKDGKTYRFTMCEECCENLLGEFLMKILQINTTCGIGSTGKICVGISQVLTEKNIENYTITFAPTTDIHVKVVNQHNEPLQAHKVKISYGTRSFLKDLCIRFKPISTRLSTKSPIH